MRFTLCASSAELLVLGALLAWASPVQGQESKDTKKTADLELRGTLRSIQADRVMHHVKVLASPSLEGREAGGPGARKAAQYITDRFREVGLRAGGQAGSFHQTFKIRTGYRIRGTLFLEVPEKQVHKPFRRGQHYMPIHLPRDEVAMVGDLVLVGYGITAPRLEFDEYRGVDVKGKVVLVFGGVPWPREAQPWVFRVDPTPFSSLAYKVRNAAEHGAAAVLVVDDPAGWRRWIELGEQFRTPDRDFPVRSAIPVVQVSRGLAAELVGASEKRLRLLANDIRGEQRPKSKALPGRRVRYAAKLSGRAVIGRNVVGVLLGRDPVLRKEAVVIGAHYDHLGEGVKGTYRGANDNASGVSGLLEISRALASLPLPRRPRRSVVFVAFAAEEIGRLGSATYVTQAPIPIKRTVLMINFDMIGRNDPNHIYAVASRSSPELHELHQRLNRHVGLKLTHPARYRLGLSDHTAFFRARVPILYFFGGRHPGYHTPRDTPDKIEQEKIVKVARLALLTAWGVADRQAPLTFQGYKAE